MNTDIERLIKMAAEGGSISDRQREIILRKAQEAGEDLDEVQFMMKMAVREAKEESFRKHKEEEEPKNIELKDRQLNKESQMHISPQVERIVQIQEKGNIDDSELIKEKCILGEIEAMETLLAKLAEYKFKSEERDQIHIEISKQIRMVRAKYGNDMRIDSFEKRVNETIDEYKREEKLSIIGLFVLVVIILLTCVFLR